MLSWKDLRQKMKNNTRQGFSQKNIILIAHISMQIIMPIIKHLLQSFQLLLKVLKLLEKEHLTLSRNCYRYLALKNGCLWCKKIKQNISKVL